MPNIELVILCSLLIKKLFKERLICSQRSSEGQIEMTIFGGAEQISTSSYVLFIRYVDRAMDFSWAVVSMYLKPGNMGEADDMNYSNQWSLEANTSIINAVVKVQLFNPVIPYLVVFVAIYRVVKRYSQLKSYE